MTPLHYLGYGILALIGLYLAYIVSVSLIGLFWFIIKIFVFGSLLILIIIFLHRKGFFDMFKS